MRFRFSICDLLWLTVVVALAIGWWLDHCGTQHELDEWRRAHVAKEFENFKIGLTPST